MTAETENSFWSATDRESLLPFIRTLNGEGLRAKWVRGTAATHGLAGGIIDIDDVDLFH